MPNCAVTAVSQCTIITIKPPLITLCIEAAMALIVLPDRRRVALTRRAVRPIRTAARRRVRRMLHALVLSRTWAFRSRSPRTVWKWLSQRIGTSAACSPVKAVLHPASIVTTKADRQSARRRCCGSINSDLVAGQFVEPLSDRGGVIDD